MIITADNLADSFKQSSGVQDKMLSMAVANHVLWPLAKFVNAKLVPKKHQPVANKVVQV